MTLPQSTHVHHHDEHPVLLNVDDLHKSFPVARSPIDWLCRRPQRAVRALNGVSLAVRTGEPGERNAAGISLLLVPGDSAGLSRTRLDKMGWLCSDTAHLRFDGVRVPARYLLGEEGVGFKAIMGNFNGERFGIACGALGFAQACHDEALAWAQQRQAFGRPLVDQQVVRHRLVDMQQRIRSTAAWLEQVAARADAGDTGADWIGESQTLYVHVRWLREKIEEDPASPRRLLTVRNVGYKLVAA